MMRPYVPENADVVYVDGARHGEELLTLLKDEKGSVLIVNGAVLPVGVFSGGAVYSADAKECCKVLKEHGAFAAFPKGAEITKGFLPVGDDEELRSAQDMCRRKIADKHFAAGVSIMDPNNTYIDPRVKIGSGTVILPGTILRGRTVIGKNCTIGPNAMIRDCTVGDETEVNASQLNESTVGAHDRRPLCLCPPELEDRRSCQSRRLCRDQKQRHRQRHEDLAPHLRRRQRLRRAHQLRLRHGHDELRRL